MLEQATLRNVTKEQLTGIHGTLHYYKNSREKLILLSVMIMFYFLQAMYLSVTFSQLITFQIAFR